MPVHRTRDWAITPERLTVAHGLVKSSGHTFLDRAAIRNVTGLSGIPRAARWLEGNEMDMVLPLRCRQPT